MSANDQLIPADDGWLDGCCDATGCTAEVELHPPMCVWHFGLLPARCRDTQEQVLREHGRPSLQYRAVRIHNAMRVAMIEKRDSEHLRLWNKLDPFRDHFRIQAQRDFEVLDGGGPGV